VSTDPALDIRLISAEEAFPLRLRYLRPQLPPEASRYPGDEHEAAIHLGAYAPELVGAASLLPRTESGEVDLRVYQLQGVVAVPAARNRGIGSRLVQEGLAHLAARGADRVWCDGRTPARSFYERLGFAAVGEEFVTPATGPHFRFVLDLG
jgi:ribosomal protein S18 acetylase RimI-like enzyme